MSRLLTATEARHFKKIIDAYKPSEVVLERFKQSNFAVIAGPAGAGKDTLRNSLTEAYPELYLPILSTTTRPLRKGEADGQTYHFRTVEQVETGLARGQYFQTALVHNQQISCLHVDEVNKLNARQYGISIMIPAAEAEMRAYHPGVKTIFVIPPDAEILKRRINAHRMLDAAEINRRLQAARAELTYALESAHYYCLVSDTVEHIRDAAHSYLQENRRDESADQRARRAIQEILKSLGD